MTEQEFNREMDVVLDYAGARFLQTPLDLTRYLHGDGSAALVMSLILNLLRMKKANDDDRERLRCDDFWFPCPAGRIQSELGMTKDRQMRIVDTLVERSLLLTSRRRGNIMWVKVVIDTLRGIRSGSRETRNLGSRETRNPEVGKPEIPISNNLSKNSDLTPTELDGRPGGRPTGSKGVRQNGANGKHDDAAPNSNHPTKEKKKGRTPAPPQMPFREQKRKKPIIQPEWLELADTFHSLAQKLSNTRIPFPLPVRSSWAYGMAKCLDKVHGDRARLDRILTFLRSNLDNDELKIRPGTPSHLLNSIADLERLIGKKRKEDYGQGDNGHWQVIDIRNPNGSCTSTMRRVD